MNPSPLSDFLAAGSIRYDWNTTVMSTFGSRLLGRVSGEIKWSVPPSFLSVTGEELVGGQAFSSKQLFRPLSLDLIASCSGKGSVAPVTGQIGRFVWQAWVAPNHTLDDHRVLHKLPCVWQGLLLWQAGMSHAKEKKRTPELC